MGLPPGPHYQGEVFEALNTLARVTLCVTSLLLLFTNNPISVGEGELQPVSHGKGWERRKNDLHGEEQPIGLSRTVCSAPAMLTKSQVPSHGRE